MTATPSDIAAPAAPAPAPKSSFARMVGVLFSPSETFADIARVPDVLVPLLTIVVLVAVTSFVMVPKMDFETMMRDQMSQSGRQMSNDDMDRVVKIGTATGKMMTYAAPVLNIIMMTIIAAVLLFAFRIMGGEGNFKQAFSVTVYSWIPLLIFGIIATIILATRDAITPDQMATLVRSNPGFLADPKSQRVLFALLSSIDVFTIWSLALLSIGFSYVSRFSKAKSAAIVVTLWIVLTVFKLGFAALGAAKAKAAAA